MRQTIDEWNWLHKQRAQPKAQEREYQRQATLAVSKRAELVVSHPGWQTFLDHLGTLRDNAQRALDSETRAMVEDDVIGDPLTKMKLTAAELRGRVRGYREAMELIPTLIALGHEAEPADKDKVASAPVPPTDLNGASPRAAADTGAGVSHG